MKALIVEDELMAAKSLIKTLEHNFTDISIVGTTTSIAETVSWLNNPYNKADIIFMDVELSDGKCFEIFKRANITARVIMTTAYDKYAIKAFEVNSIDYILKPIELPALARAVERCRRTPEQIDINKIIESLSENSAIKKYKERHLVHFNDRVIPIKTSDIIYLFSKEKDNHIVTRDRTVYVIDQSLDSIIEELDPSRFFRISRGCIIAKEAVESVTKIFGGRLNLILKDDMAVNKSQTSYSAPDLNVSRARAEDFLNWLEK